MPSSEPDLRNLCLSKEERKLKEMIQLRGEVDEAIANTRLQIELAGLEHMSSLQERVH